MKLQKLFSDVMLVFIEGESVSLGNRFPQGSFREKRYQNLWVKGMEEYAAKHSWVMVVSNDTLSFRNHRELLMTNEFSVVYHTELVACARAFLEVFGNKGEKLSMIHINSL